MTNLPSAEITQAMKEICWLQAFPLQKLVDVSDFCVLNRCSIFEYLRSV